MDGQCSRFRLERSKSPSYAFDLGNLDVPDVFFRSLYKGAEGLSVSDGHVYIANRGRIHVLGMMPQAPLRLESSSRFRHGDVEITYRLSGQPGRLLTIEESTDLKNWQRYRFVTLREESLEFKAPKSLEIESKFFRTGNPWLQPIMK